MTVPTRRFSPQSALRPWRCQAAFCLAALVVGIAGCQPPAKPVAQQEAAGAPEPPPAATERVAALPGVGKQGQSLTASDSQGVAGMIVEPARAYFKAKQKIVFEIQVPNALKLYKGLNGAAPKDHDEFMQKVIQENRIQLPELPAGQRYVYDPETEQLMVERPAANAPPQ